MHSLFKTLKKFSEKDKLRFHVPGHNGGNLYSRDFSRNMFNIDVTEFDETDDLQHPSSILCEAQNRAAKIFGAKNTYFITCGSSLSIQAMIMGAFNKGDRIIVDRNCHKSVISALMLGGISPVFAYPEFDYELSIYSAITPAQVSDLLDENPDIKGALITSPTYYGICSDIKEIANILHSKNKLLVVDEAHGADFIFSEYLPETALECGADLCVQSVHKTLPCLTQCSLLHVGKKSKVSISRLERILRMLHTTSPSYLLMSSIDEGIRLMQKHAKSRISDLTLKLENMKTKIRIANRIDIIDESSLKFDQNKSILRLVLSFKKLGISGFKACELLKHSYGIYAEAADIFNVVFVITASNTAHEIDLLESAIEKISTGDYSNSADLITSENICPIPKIELAYEPYSAFEKDFETLSVSSDKLINRICANIYSVCPPGSAILIPGQKIDVQALEYIRKFTDFKEIDVLIAE